jgi:hypothetical protein
MSDSSTSTPVADPSGATPTTTFYQQIAAKIAAAVNESVVQIPGYTDDLSEAARKARRVASPQFVELTLSAIESSEQLSAAKPLDVVAARDGGQFSQAFQPLSDQLLGVVRRLALMMRVYDARSGRGALQAYNIAQRLALNPNNTHLAVHVENLKAELKRPRKAKKPSPTPAPSPTPPPAAPAPAGGGAPTT